MEEKVQVIIDSTVYLEDEFIKKHNLKVASLNVIDGEDTYTELSIDNDFIFGRLNNKAKLTTSQPAPSEFVDLYEEALKKGVDKILVVTLSKGLSGTYQSALLAKNMVEDKAKIHVFDTDQAAYGNELLTIKLLQYLKEEKTVDAVIKRMDEAIKRISLYFTVENLYNLQKGGRLSKTQALIGTVLRVKPIIKVVDGKLKLNHKERTHKKVLAYLLNEIELDPFKNKGKLTARIIERNSMDNAENLQNAILERYPNAEVEITSKLGPVFSIHIGDQGFGISWLFE